MSNPYSDHRLMNTVTTRPATREEKIVNPGVYEVKVEQEPVANASEWFALVMNAAAELEDASNCLRDEDAKRVAISGAKHYRDAAKALYTTPPAAPVQEPVAQAWDEGYRAGINDERMSETNIGIAGMGMKVEPARNNPYRTTPPAAQRQWVGLTDEEMKKVHTDAGVTYFVPADYDRHLFTHMTDVQIMKVSRAIEAAHGITGETK